MVRLFKISNNDVKWSEELEKVMTKIKSSSKLGSVQRSFIQQSSTKEIVKAHHKRMQTIVSSSENILS